MSNFNVPYLVGNTYLRDYQFWPTTSGALAAASVNLPLDMLMQIAWRVREWTVSAGSFSFTGATVPDLSGNWAEFIVKMKRKGPTFDDDGLYRDVTDESDILGPSTEFTIAEWPTLRNAGIFDHTPATGLSLPDFFGFVTGQMLGGLITFDPATKLFLTPSSFVTALMVNSPIAPRAEIIFGLDPAGTSGSFTLEDSAGAVGFTTGLKIQGRNTGFPYEGSGTVSNITMTATKWWKYKNTLGLDVYEENSGAQVADPFA